MPNSYQELEKYEFEVSVIIPTYRPGDYIFECIDSVCRQTLDEKKYEVIIVVNGCNEPFVSNIKGFLSEGRYLNSIVVIQTDISGVSNARNLGIESSKGGFVTFVDDDDIVSRNYLEELLRVSGKDCVGCSNSYSFCDDVNVHTDNFLTEAYKSCKGKQFNFYRYRKFLSPPVGKLIHKSIINKERFPVNLSRSEDSVFCLKIANRINDMNLTSESCIYYIRQRQGSVTRRGRSLMQEIIVLLKIEFAYFVVWLRHPFSYNLKFVGSRFVAAFNNFIYYCKSNKQKK